MIIDKTGKIFEDRRKNEERRVKEQKDKLAEWTAQNKKYLEK